MMEFVKKMKNDGSVVKKMNLNFGLRFAVVWGVFFLFFNHGDYFLEVQGFQPWGFRSRGWGRRGHRNTGGRNTGSQQRRDVARTRNAAAVLGEKQPEGKQPEEEEEQPG